jgi:hypothetical protein
VDGLLTLTVKRTVTGLIMSQHRARIVNRFRDPDARKATGRCTVLLRSSQIDIPQIRLCDGQLFPSNTVHLRSCEDPQVRSFIHYLVCCAS